MRLTDKLLGYLNRVFLKDPKGFVALEIAYDGALTWAVADNTLSTEVVGGSGVALSVDLSSHTIQSLAAHLAGQVGYSVSGLDASRAALSAKVLLDGEGDAGIAGGGRLFGYTSLLWAYLEGAAEALSEARDQIVQMLRQMDVNTAEGAWLDELGGYYSVPREQGEIDASYGPRIIAETLRPRGNNVAIEVAIQAYTGQAATVVDVVEFAGIAPLYNGVSTYSGSQNHNAVAVTRYGLFDVEYAYDLLDGGDVTAHQASVQALINRLRDAGTHLRSLALTESSITDAAVFALVDGLAVSLSATLADSADAWAEDFGAYLVQQGDLVDAPDAGVDDGGVMSSTFAYGYSGSYTYGGTVSHAGGILRVETLEGAITSETPL